MTFGRFSLIFAAAPFSTVWANTLTVDTSGNTVVQSAISTFQDLQFTGLRGVPYTLTPGTSSSAAVDIPSGHGEISLTFSTSTTADGWVRLPAAVPGKRVDIHTTSARGYTILPKTGSMVNMASSTYVSSADTTFRCEALTDTAWLCAAPDGYQRIGLNTQSGTATFTVADTTDVVTLTLSADSQVVTLPSVSLGKELTIHQPTSGKAYTLTAASGDYINDAATTTTFAVAATEPTVVCRGMSASRWECTVPRGYMSSKSHVTAGTTNTLTASDSGKSYYASSAATFTLPTCNQALDYSIFVATGKVTITPTGTDYIIHSQTKPSAVPVFGATGAATALEVTAAAASATAGTLGGTHSRVMCASSGVWVALINLYAEEAN